MMSTTCRINSSPFKMAIFVIRRRVFSLTTLRHSIVSTAAAAAAVPTRNFSFRLFDRLIPEDDPETKARKEKEKAIVHSKLHRSKFAEMLSAPKEKLIFATGEVVAPGDAFAPCPAVTVRDGTPLVLTDVFVRAPVTLVTLAFQALGQEQLEPWIDTFVATFDAQREEAARESNGKSSLPQLLNMVYVEGWLFRALAPIVSRSIRNALPPTLVDRTAVVFQTSEKTTDYFCDSLRIHNKVMGHVFLVDRLGGVRWRAHSSPTEAELPAMLQAISALVKVDTLPSRRRG